MCRFCPSVRFGPLYERGRKENVCLGTCCEGVVLESDTLAVRRLWEQVGVDVEGVGGNQTPFSINGTWWRTHRAGVDVYA